MVIELSVVQFWSEIILVISNRTRAARSFDFEITRMISDQISVHSGQTIARILQPYNMRVAHKPITTLRRLLTNVKEKDKPEDRQEAVYKIKSCDCQASYIGETGRNLSTRLTEHKRATRNGDVNNHIAEYRLKTKHQIDWDSATCITYSIDYYQRLTLESWFTNLEHTEHTPLNRSQQLPAPCKRLIDEIKQN